MILQGILPLLTITIGIGLGLLYLIFFSSMWLKNVIGHGTYVFVRVVEKICTSSGDNIDLWRVYRTREIFHISNNHNIFYLTPYLLPFLLKMIKKFIQCITGNTSATLIFKPAEAIFCVNALRYVMYILLFFTSVFTYRVNTPQALLIKEALLEFVLLDMVIYSIYSNLKDTRINHRQQNMKKYYIPVKYDLEFVLSAIAMHNLTNKEIYARIKFSVDIDRIMKGKKQKGVNEINNLLKDISTNYYKTDILKQSLKKRSLFSPF